MLASLGAGCSCPLGTLCSRRCLHLMLVLCPLGRCREGCHQVVLVALASLVEAAAWLGHLAAWGLVGVWVGAAG